MVEILKFRDSDLDAYLKTYLVQFGLILEEKFYNTSSF